MRETVLLALTFSGLYVMCSNVIREYHYVNSPKTWAEAQKFCREMYTDLATVGNKNQEANIQHLLATQKPGNFAWIGLFDDMKNWKWTMGNGTFDGDKSFYRWEKYQPDNENSQQGCAVMNWIGFWRDEACETERPFVCFNEQGSSKYILVTTFMTWDVARNYCQSKYTDLVTVRNLDENQNIQPMLTRNVWIGLRRNLWANWSDQSLTAFTNWYADQPDNTGDTPTSCAAVDTATGSWWDMNCNNKYEFICESLISRQRFKLQLQSDTELNEAEIQQQILQQLQDKLDADDLKNLKLRWIQNEGQVFHKEPKKTEGLKNSGDV